MTRRARATTRDNAVGVWSSSGDVGYIDRGHADDFRQTFDRLRAACYHGAFLPA